MEELSCAAQLWLADSSYCHHTSEGMGKGKNLTGVACWGDLHEPACPHLLGHLAALKPGCLEPPGSARVPAMLCIHVHGHRLSPVVPSACCLPSNHLWVHLFLRYYHEKAFTSSMDTAWFASQLT